MTETQTAMARLQLWASEGNRFTRKVVISGGGDSGWSGNDYIRLWWVAAEDTTYGTTTRIESGPQASPEDACAAAIERLHDAGIDVL